MKYIPEEKDALIVTLNKMGYMNTQPEFYNDAFINFSSKCSDPCLEIGTAYGKSTIAALEKGAKIIANDLSADHLEIVFQNTPEHLRKNLTLIQGAFPEALSIEDNSLGAVLSSRMLNFIDPDTLPAAMDNIFKWLKPGGKFFVLVGSPFMHNFFRFLPEYWENKANNTHWPGLLQNIPAYVPERSDDLPYFINLLDIEVVSLLLNNAGFHIEKIGYSGATPLHPQDMRSDGREHVGVIAVKPKN